MVDLFSEAKKLRTLLGNISDAEKFDFTVYLGLYNAEKYIESVISQLLNQTDQDFFLVVADNNSDDKTWQRVPELLEIFKNRVVAAKNPINLGGGGGLAFNFDLIQTDWFCALHQDDLYFPNHVQRLRKSIKFASQDVIGISADMGSISDDGKRIANKPRASWILKEFDPASSFIANLRSHVVPFPATTFRRSDFEKAISSWHSTSFVDTEAILLMSNQGRFDFSNVMTMRYRENQMSESHSINNHESLFGTGVSLARVFSSSAFKDIAQSIEVDDRKIFLKAINEAVEIRLGKSEFSKFVQLIFAENCMIAWGYGEADSLLQVKTYFKEVGSNFTPELLTNILEFLGENSNISETIPNSSTSEFLNTFLNSSDINVNINNSNFSRIYKLYNLIMNFSPYSLQKFIGRIILKSRIALDPKHPWNFKWK